MYAITLQLILVNIYLGNNMGILAQFNELNNGAENLIADPQSVDLKRTKNVLIVDYLINQELDVWKKPECSFIHDVSMMIAFYTRPGIHQPKHMLEIPNNIKYLLEGWKRRGLINTLDNDKVSGMLSELRGLYKTLKNHPALMERRLRVGGRLPPTITPNLGHANKKRSVFDVGLAVPACPFTTEWTLLFSAKDVNNTLVEVFQPVDDSNRYQWFYKVSCDYSLQFGQQFGACPSCCRGINGQSYESRCIPKKSFVMALIRRQRAAVYDWDYVQVDTSCNCAVLPR